MRAKKLTFGQRVHCPFLRPFFLTAADEARIRVAAETIALLGERVIRAAFESDDIYHQLGMTEAEDALVDIEPGYQTASTTSRLDAFLLPDSLYFAEYNAESPAGIGYTQRLCELFDATAVMGRFRATRQVALPQGHRRAPRGADGQLPRVGRHGQAADDGDRRLAGRADVDGVRDPARRVHGAGVPTIVCDPRELVFANGASDRAGHADRSGVPPRPRQRHPRPTRRVPRARRRVRRPRGLHGQLLPLQARAQEGLLRGADGPVARVALLGGRTRGDSGARPVDARARRRGDAQGRLAGRPAGARRARGASTWCSSRTTSTAARASTSGGR